MTSKFNTLIDSETPVLIDFYADWCSPCKSLSPILSEVKKELGSRVKILKIDVEKNQLLAAYYKIKGVPTLLLFKDGNQVWRESGVLQKDEIIQVITST